jgi:hypothetical protein
MKAWTYAASAVALAMLIGGCGQQPRSAAVATEGFWFPGVHSSDLISLLAGRGLTCGEPEDEEGKRVWVCEASTPLTTYQVEFAGSMSKIESLRAMVTQTGQAKDSLSREFLGHVAAVKCQGAEPAAARKWVEENLDAGGEASFGPVAYRLTGAPGRRVLVMRAIAPL